MAARSRTQWTEDLIAERASLFQSRRAFQKGDTAAYKAAFRRGILDKVCGHMELRQKPRGYWTKERCAEEALKYDQKARFEEGAGSAYNKARSSGWLDEICGHMRSPQLPQGYWDQKIRCAEEALKFDSKTDFARGAPSAHSAACRNGWLDELCSHMQIKKRPNGYWTKELCIKAAAPYTLLSDFMVENNAAYLAATRNGWWEEVSAHLKRAKWTKEQCSEIAAKYSALGEFMEAQPHVYVAIRRYNWGDVCAHMERKAVETGYWTEGRIREIAAEYDNVREFRNNESACATQAHLMGIYLDITERMERNFAPFNIAKPAICYYIRYDRESGPIYKIGVTNHSVEKRFEKSDQPDKIVKVWRFERGADAKMLEAEILNANSESLYDGDHFLKSGNTELFTHDVLRLDTVS